MTTQNTNIFPRVNESSPAFQSTTGVVLNGKQKESLWNHRSEFDVRAVPIQPMFKMANGHNGSSFMSTKTSNPITVLEQAASAAVDAGRRSEASAELVMRSFPRLQNGPFLPQPENPIPAPYKVASTRKLLSKRAPTQPKKLQPKKQGKKKPAKKPTKKATKKQSSKTTKTKGQKTGKAIKGHRSSWNLFYSDFASNNPRTTGVDLARSAARQYKLLTKEEKAHYAELSEADRIRVLTQNADQSTLQSNFKLPSGFANSHIQYSNVKNLLPFLKEQETNANKLVPRLNMPQSIFTLENIFLGQRLEQNNRIVKSICACLDMKSLVHLQLCSSFLHEMNLVGQEKARRKHQKNQRKSHPMTQLEYHSGSLSSLPVDCGHVGPFQFASPFPGPTCSSPAPSAIPSSQQHKPMEAIPVLPSCFRTRPPVDPLCKLGTMNLGFEDAAAFGDGTTRDGNEITGSNQIPTSRSKNDCSSTLHDGSPRDIAKHLLHQFLGRYGLFWPFQYWLLHVMQEQIAKAETNQQGALRNDTSPIHVYYQDPVHPFRKFFHPCSTKYLAVMDTLSGKLTNNFEVLEEFRKLAHDVALNFPFFRDGLHYVLQNADAKAFQPLLGIPDSHALPFSEAIYNGI